MENFRKGRDLSRQVLLDRTKVLLSVFIKLRHYEDKFVVMLDIVWSLSQEGITLFQCSEEEFLFILDEIEDHIFDTPGFEMPFFSALREISSKDNEEGLRARTLSPEAAFSSAQLLNDYFKSAKELKESLVFVP